MYTKSFLFIAITLLLAGCASSEAIKDLEEDKVIVVEAGDLRSKAEDIEKMAQEGCALHGRRAVPISSVTEYNGLAGYRHEHLFACVP